MSLPALSGDGSAVAFLSNSDLGGTNPLLSPELFAYRTNTSSFRKLTDYNFQGGFLPTNTMRQLDGDGGLVLYTESIQQPGMQWVLQDTASGTIRKMGPDFGEFLNPSGTFALFVSDADLVGHNADGSWELFRYDVSNDSFTQLTQDNADPITIGGTAASDDGNSVLIISGADLVPGGNPLGYPEVFLLDVPSGTWRQLTSGPSGGRMCCLSVSDDGSRAVFNSSGDFLGENPDLSTEVFLIDVPSGSLSQVTDGELPLDSNRGSISGDGTTIAIISTQDLTGENPDRNGELFIYRWADHTLAQVTDATTGGIVVTAPAVNRSGTAVAVMAAGDYTGENPDGNPEIFLFSPPEVSAPGIPGGSHTSRLLLIVLIAAGGLWILARRAALT